MLNGLIETPIISSYKGSQGDTEIVLINGSTIKFRSTAQEDSLRGESVNYLIMDECAFTKESVFKEILLPMLNAKGEKVLLLTTPKGKNWVYYMWLKGYSNEDPKYKSFRFTSSDNPHSNKEIIQIAKESMPDSVFKQEYLAEFVDSTSIFENINDVCTLNPITTPVTNDHYYVGVDIAMKNDYTVIIIFNQKYEMVYMDRFTNIEAIELQNKLLETFNKFKPKKIYIESNNQGQPIIDNIKGKVPNIEGFVTSSTSKPMIINNLINSFATNKIKLLNNDTLKMELEAFTMTFSADGKAKFSAPSGFNDDCVMSLAIALECINKNLTTGKYTFL